ncbi:MAG: FtsX-like permease family protein [Cyclobacteriaceae bacterium]
MNIVGLAIGLGITFYIALFIISELSYENMHSKADRTFRVSMHVQDDNYDTHWARVNRDWVKNMAIDIPEIKHLIRFQDYYPRLTQVGTDNYKISHAYSVDSMVFEIFDFNLLLGDPKTALAQPFSVVLTQKMARTFFGDQDPMGEEISIISTYGSKKEIFMVTGVMEDIPSNTHLPVNLLTSFSSEEERTGWAYTYVLLQKNSDLPSLEGKISEFIQRKATDEDVATVKLPLQNIKTIHLNSDLAREIKLNGKKSHLWLFGIAGLIVLIMSAINFINLNAAQSLRKLPEIGVRKVLGSARRNLVLFFFLESGIMCLIGGMLAIAFVVVSIPLFREFTPIAFSVVPLGAIAGIVMIIIALLAGIFPALVLTDQPVVSSITGSVFFGSSRNTISPKNLLVALQLILCITLISCTLITRSQFQFLTEKKLGFDKEQVLAVLDLTDSVKNKYNLFKEQLSKLSFVRGVTAAMQVPSTAIRDNGPIYAEGMTYETQPVIDVQVVDEDFIEVMGIKLLAGRNFHKVKNPDVPREDLLDYLQTQPREYIVNQMALDVVGWKTPEEALGRQFSWGNGAVQLQRGPIVGVIEDFHQESLKNSIEPLVMLIEPSWTNNILIKLSGENMSEQVAAIEDIWGDHFPEFHMDYAFVDELYQKIYETEQKQLQLIYVFSALAIFIAFLGIFGLFSYALKTREKELAIRKVLGASLSSITLLLSKHFLYLALIGICIALPLTWYVMEKWLENFVYRVDIDLVNFLIAMGLTIVTLLITVSLQIKRIGQNNPASILRSD